MRNFFIISVFFLLIIKHSFCQTSGLDSSFNNIGYWKANTSYGLFDGSIALSTAIQADGKIIVGGVSSRELTSTWIDVACVFRFLTDGTIDSSFGTNGVVWLEDTFGLQSAASFVIIQADQKIIVGGQNCWTCDLAVRLNTDGSIDRSYGQSGFLRFDSPVYGKLEFSNACLQFDEKTLFVGTIDVGASSELAAIRFDTDGNLDSTFGVGGLKLLNTVLPFPYHFYNLIMLQPDSQIVLAAFTRAFSAMRLNRFGDLDSSFGINGVANIPVGNWSRECTSAKLQADGKIILGGYSIDTSNNRLDDFTLVRLNSNGTLDSSFGNNGVVLTDFNLISQRIKHISISLNGRIFAVGNDLPLNGLSDFIIACYDIDGSLNSSFGTNGYIQTNFDSISSRDEPYSSIFQSDGKLLIVGKGTNYYGTAALYVAMVARYVIDLTLGLISFSPRDNSLLIYPNPIIGPVTLKYELQEDEILSVDIFNTEGRLMSNVLNSVFRSKGEHEEKIILSPDLKSGTYYLIMKSNKGKLTIRLIKL